MSITFWVNPSLCVYQTALAALRAGISCIPILADGSKRPAVRWKHYQHQQPNPSEVRGWFQQSEWGIAFITGQVSGGLEMLDFDTHDVYHAWAERMRGEGYSFLLERIERGYKEVSPNGVHLFVRSPAREGNKKLARTLVSERETVKSLIETRGNGGYGLVAPSCGNVHPSGRPYQLLRGGVSMIPAITLNERALLFACARTFDESPSHAVPPSPLLLPKTGEHVRRGRRPGDIFNERVSWEDLLCPHGWEVVCLVGEETQWRRPGKEGGVSATTNYKGSNLLYVFSTSTLFEAERGYSKFSAYALLEHAGDFSAAAKALAEKGYCE